MAGYLSRAWFDEVNGAARASADLRSLTTGTHVTIQQVVTGAPSGDVRYWVRIDNGAVEARPGLAGSADATVTQSYDTAVAVSRGELAVEHALLDGRIRVAGDVRALLRHAGALGGVAAAFGQVRDRTSYG